MRIVDQEQGRYAEEALAWVAELAECVESAKFDLAVAVRKAQEQGLSLRDIAPAARMSHEQVRRITIGAR